MPRFADRVRPPADKSPPGPSRPRRSEPQRGTMWHILQLKAAQAAAPGQTARAAHPSGLPAGLKVGVEALSGIAMDDVRVHRASPKPARLGALAYARGNEIHLGPGQERHLPHEAWHVVQQKQGRVKPTLLAKGMAINDEPALEREADLMGAAATQHRTPAPALQTKDLTSASGHAIQRTNGHGAAAASASTAAANAASNSAASATPAASTPVATATPPVAPIAVPIASQFEDYLASGGQLPDNAATPWASANWGPPNGELRVPYGRVPYGYESLRIHIHWGSQANWWDSRPDLNLKGDNQGLLGLILENGHPNFWGWAHDRFVAAASNSTMMKLVRRHGAPTVTADLIRGLIAKVAKLSPNGMPDIAAVIDLDAIKKGDIWIPWAKLDASVTGVWRAPFSVIPVAPVAAATPTAAATPAAAASTPANTAAAQNTSPAATPAAAAAKK